MLNWAEQVTGEIPELHWCQFQFLNYPAENIIQFYLAVSNTHSLDAAAIDFSSVRISENNCQGQLRDNTDTTVLGWIFDIPHHIS